MVVVPCSMKSLAGIAHGLSRNLVERAADVMLKERRTLIIVPRETPMSLPQLRNMVLCAEAGAMILPAMPAFYQMPKTLDDLADFMAGKILSALGFAARSLSVLAGMTTSVPAPDAGFACRRQDARAHCRHVRRDCAALRPAQSRAQRRPRSPLAQPRRRCARSRRVGRTCSTSAQAPRISPWPLRGGSPEVRSLAWTSRPRCSGSAARRCALSGSERASGSCVAMRTRIPLRGRLVRRGDSGVRYSQRGRAVAGAGRAGACAPARRAIGHPRVRPAAHSGNPHAVRVVLQLFAAARRAARSRSTRARIPTCRRRSARFRHRRSFYKCVKVRALAERVPSL